jgi:hypothetical protein
MVRHPGQGELKSESVSGAGAVAPAILQISLPQELTISDEDLVEITGRRTVPAQMKWLDENGWTYALSADRGIKVGKLYAHLRLAGLHPVDLKRAPAQADGFDLDATR